MVSIDAQLRQSIDQWLIGFTTHIAAEAGLGLDEVADQFITTVSQLSRFLLRHHTIGYLSTARRDLCAHGICQKQILFVQIIEQRDLAFQEIAVEPSQGRGSAQLEALHLPLCLRSFDRSFGYGNAGLALGRIGKILHDADFLHRHRVGIESASIRPGDGIVVDTGKDLGVR